MDRDPFQDRGILPFTSVLDVFRAMGPHIERIVDVSISPPSDDLICLSKEKVKYLQHNAQDTNVLFSALSEDVFDARHIWR